MSDEKQTPPSLKEIDVFYEKAEGHRTVQSDGAWAGLTPQLDIQVAFTKELQHMPTRVRYEVIENGLGPEISKDAVVGILREAVVTVVVNPVVAVQLIRLLQEMVGKVRDRLPPELQQDLDRKVVEASPKSQKDVSGT